MKMYITEHRVTFVRSEGGKIPALTSISKKVYELLLKRSLLTLEIKSAHNINALQPVKKGDFIFLTPILREDLLPRAEGVICEIQEKKVMLQKKKHWDEVEIITVRLQVKLQCTARIRSVEKEGLDDGVSVEVDRAVQCSIS